MEEKILNEEESLELISQMILKTKKRFEGGRVKPFLIFGYSTLILSIVVYYLITKTGNYYYHALWFLIPIIGYIGIALSKKSAELVSYNQIDSIINSVWFVCGMASFLISISAFFIRIPILSIVVLLMGIGTAITGLIIKSKLITISGFIGMLSCAALFFIKGNEQILAFGLVFLVMMIIPGHFLTQKNRVKNV